MSMHLYQAGIFLYSRSADGAIPMAAFLYVFHEPRISALFLVGSVIAAVFGQWGVNLPPLHRFFLLVPQQSLLIITAWMAIFASLHGSFADFVPRPWEFISCGEYPRIVMPVAYGSAILARLLER